MLPKLPKISAKMVPGTDRVLLFPEPAEAAARVSNLANKLLNDKQKKDLYAQMQEESQQNKMQKGSLIKAIVLAVPIDLDSTKFAYKVNDVVLIPDAPTYDITNIDKTPLLLAGTRDIKAIVDDLTEEEATKWNKNQEMFINNVVYPPLDSPSPGLAIDGQGNIIPKR